MTDTVYKGEFVKAELATSATSSLANLSDSEFEQRLALLKKGAERIARVKRELMKEDVHYGVIPGTPKPTLLKPGAEVLCGIYNLVPETRLEYYWGDNVTSPWLRVIATCHLRLGDLEGPVVGLATGSASTWETKHRYRRGQRTCPACGHEGSIIKGKADYGGGWLCWQKKDGCGAKFDGDDQAIIGQAVDSIDNPDPAELENTIIKMASKRAEVAATIKATKSSDLFTQDIEDAPNDGTEVKREVAKGQQSAQKKAPQTSKKEEPKKAQEAAPAAWCPSQDEPVYAANLETKTRKAEGNEGEEGYRPAKDYWGIDIIDAEQHHRVRVICWEREIAETVVESLEGEHPALLNVTVDMTKKIPRLVAAKIVKANSEETDDQTSDLFQGD